VIIFYVARAARVSRASIATISVGLSASERNAEWNLSAFDAIAILLFIACEIPDTALCAGKEGEGEGGSTEVP